MVFHDLGSKFNLLENGRHFKALFMLITMVQIPASYLIPSPRYLVQYIAQKFGLIPIPCIQSLMKGTSYLGTLMRYDAGNCAIMISMKRVFKGCPKMFFFIFGPIDRTRPKVHT